MISKVDVEIKDSRAGAGNAYESGIHAKVGVSPMVSKEPIVIKNTMDSDNIRALLGDSPLADACIDSVDGGAQLIYCFPIKATSGGVAGAVKHTGEGEGTVSVSGQANNKVDLIVRIVESGETNAGTYVMSEDGGQTWSDENTIPLSGKVSAAAGFELTFDGTFAAGDTYAVSADAPSATNEAILEALDMVYTCKAAIEFVHVVGTTTASLWAAIESKAQTQETSCGLPIFVICEQRAPETEETLESYVDAIKNDCQGAGHHVCVVQSWARFVRLDGRTQDVNVAGYLCGLIAQSKESTSISYVKEFAVSEGKVLELVPEGITDYMEELDAARYLTLRRYPGRDDWYVTSANTCAPEDTDFSYIEAVRVMYRLVREVYKRATGWLNADYDAADLEVALVPVQEDLNIPVEEAVESGIISSGEVVITDAEEVANNDRLPIRITYQSRRYSRQISLTFMAQR